MTSLSSDLTNDLADVVAGSTVIAVWMSWLPEVAVVLTIVWTLIRIFEWGRVRLWGFKPGDKA